MNTLQIGSATFVRRTSQAVDALFTGPRTPSGLFKPLKYGVLFSTLAGEPFAFLVANRGQSQFFVSCSRLADGKIRYQFGLSWVDEAKLGLKGMSYGTICDAAANAWTAVQSQPVTA